MVSLIKNTACTQKRERENALYDDGWFSLAETETAIKKGSNVEQNMRLAGLAFISALERIGNHGWI